MFGTVADGVKGLAEKAGVNLDEEEESSEDSSSGSSGKGTSAESLVADIDARAQTGELSFKDFLTMSEAFASMGGKQVPGMPTMTATQLLETKEKFQKHEKIVEVMLPDELDEPELLMADLKSGGSTPGPRIQRLAIASNLPEGEVGLFLMQFEAMRESTRRIADGEDPDEVTASMGAAPGANRQARRNAKKAKAKMAKKDKK